MTLLSSLIGALKRDVAVPGTFATVFPSTQDSDLTALVADAFGEAQLMGFLSTYSLQASGGDFSTLGPDPAGGQTPVPTDLSVPAQAVIVMFAAIRLVRAQLRSLPLQEKYKAGSVEYEVGRSATVLRDTLKEMSDQLNKLIDIARQQARAKAMATPIGGMIDIYQGRNMDQILVAQGFFPTELANFGLGTDLNYPIWK